MDRRLYLTAYFFLLAAALWYAAYEGQQPQAQMASVSMLDIGQGDSFLIESPEGNRLLIDGGPDESVLAELSALLPQGDRHIHAVLATHADADHIGGLPAVLDRFDVQLFLIPETYAQTARYRELFAAVSARGIPAYFVRRGMELSLGGNTSFLVLFPDRNTGSWNTNTASAVGMLRIGNRSILFTGDTPASIERFLVAAEKIDADILKLAHHGSKTSSSEAFLRAVSPSLALVSAGQNNRYGHPADEVLERLRSLGIPFVSTQESGTYTLRTDGERWYGP